MVSGGISSSPVLFLFWLIKLEQSIPIPFFFFFYFTAVLIYFSLFSVFKWLLFKFWKGRKINLLNIFLFRSYVVAFLFLKNEV